MKGAGEILMDAKLAFVDRLLKLERRVCRVYQRWAANQSFSADLRSLFREMAEEEKHHLNILESSASLLNFAAVPPQISGAQMVKIDATIAAAEQASEKPELTADEALGHALALEGSELNHIGDAWMGGFQPDLDALTRAGRPAYERHIRRLSDAVGRFTNDENLRKQAAALWSEYQREQ
jgi:rubrerythrin